MLVKTLPRSLEACLRVLIAVTWSLRSIRSRTIRSSCSRRQRSCAMASASWSSMYFRQTFRNNSFHRSAR